MDLSIVIVNWNTKMLLRDCILSISKFERYLNYEIIVVDNGSKDGSIEMIKFDFPFVKLIENETNRGYSIANNQGIKISRGRYICLLNSDTLVLKNALSKMILFLDRRLEVGAATCQLLNCDGTKQFASAYGETNLIYMISVESGLYKKFPNSKIWGKPLMSYENHSFAHEIEVCPSVAIFIRKEVINNVGMLDQNIFFGSIDWDYSYRIRKKGWKLYFNPEAKIIHYGGKSKTPIKKELLIKDYKSKYYYFWKHYGYFNMNLYRLLILISSIIKITVFIGIYIFKKKNYEKKIYRNKINEYILRLRSCFSTLRFHNKSRTNNLGYTR